jgi:hypothetical protein
VVSIPLTSEPRLISHPEREADVEERRFRPVTFWAPIGVAFVLLEAYVLVAWVAKGQFKPTPPGPTPVPTYMKVVAAGWQWGGLAAFAAFVWFVMIRPWRRERRITLDGLFCIVFFLIYWQDPISNYFQTWFTYNSYFANFGSWASNLPGFVAPHGNRLAEPYLWDWPIYVYLAFGFTLIACAVMRHAKARWPRMGKFGLVAICFAFCFGVDVVLEPLLMLLGIYSYPGSIPWLTIFHGHYYQYPVTEGIFWGGAWCAWACIRYFKDDKGRTLVERGVDDLRVSDKKRTVLRFLALVAVCNLIFAGYNLGSAVLGMMGGAWPKDVTSRSYFTDGLCGPGTQYACGGPAVPIPRGNSAHVDPQGNLVGGKSSSPTGAG